MSSSTGWGFGSVKVPAGTTFADSIVASAKLSRVSPAQAAAPPLSANAAEAVSNTTTTIGTTALITRQILALIPSHASISKSYPLSFGGGILSFQTNRKISIFRTDVKDPTPIATDEHRFKNDHG